MNRPTKRQAPTGTGIGRGCFPEANVIDRNDRNNSVVDGNIMESHRLILHLVEKTELMAMA
ncbi:hypothetical protein P4S72_07080 [Vibrio sp. PP-XX7]